MKKLLLILGLSLVSFPFAYAEEKQAPQATEQAEKNVVLEIPEMYCQLCVYLVNKELRAVEGVISTKASMKERKVNVVVKPNVENEKLIQAVEKLNYSAKVL